MRARLVMISLLAFTACGPPAATDTGEADTQSESTTDTSGTTDGGVADPLVDRCDPSADDPCAGFGGQHLCCSDDPAALDIFDLAAWVTPNYQGRGGEGTPLFSGGNNPLSRSGTCVETGSVPPAGALAEVNAQGCPVPCNPTWASADVLAVCGQGGQCCQIQELEPEDCIFDPALGDAGCWRPVNGGDIQGLGGTDTTNWSSTDHATHQDPSGLGCEVFVSGIPASLLTDANISAQELLVACYRRLTVANQRGWCSNSLGLDACPYADPAYIDACEQRNLDEGRVGC